MIFTKMHGLGNDFIVVREESGLPDNVSRLASALCDRHFGIGADGLVYLLPSSRADFMMRIINSDGTEAEQCGNAIRCAAKYAYDNGLTSKTELRIETIGAGVQPVAIFTSGGKAAAVRVDMGEPILEGRLVPTSIDQEAVIDFPLEIDGDTFHFTAVSMGNPHCVIYADDATGVDLRRWGPRIEQHPFFPNRVNVEFATVRLRSRIEMRVWERGAGPTLACGTGACAVLVASVLNGKADRKAIVALAGGELEIEWDERDNRVYMTGPAETVYSGKLETVDS